LRRCYASVPSHHESRAGRPETRCAQTSGRLIPLTIRAARRYAQGAEYRQARWRSLKVTICVGRLAKRKPTRTQPTASVPVCSCTDSLLWATCCIPAPCEANEKHRAEGFPAHSAGVARLSEDRQSDPSSGRTLRPAHRSGSARFAPTRNPGVFSFASFRLDEQTKGSRTAVRNQGFDKLVSAERLMARTARFLDEPRR
jgi:hypothetical protein